MVEDVRANTQEPGMKRQDRGARNAVGQPGPRCDPQSRVVEGAPLVEEPDSPAMGEDLLAAELEALHAALEHPPGIQDPERVERRLDRSHDVDRGLTALDRQPLPPGGADS